MSFNKNITNPSIILDISKKLQTMRYKKSTISVVAKNYKLILDKGYKLDNLDNFKHTYDELIIKAKLPYIYTSLYILARTLLSVDDFEQFKLHISKFKIRYKSQHKLEKEYLTPKERYNVIMAFDNPVHMLWAFIQDETGVRAGDIILLQENNFYFDINDELDVVLKLKIVGKGDKLMNTNVYNKDIYELFVKCILYMPVFKNYLWVIPWNKQILSYEYIGDILETLRMGYRRTIKRALRKQKLEHKHFTTHGFRYAFAREMYYQTGKDLILLKKLMNHENIQVTTKYVEKTLEDSLEDYRKVRAKTLKSNKKE